MAAGSGRADMSRFGSDVRSRRRFLTGGAAVAATALSGCLGGGSSSGESAGGTADGGGDTDGTTAGDEGSGGKTLPAPVAGDAEAAVTVAVYEDFACPHCRTYNLEELPTLWKSYVEPGRVRYEHHDFPIPVHPTHSWRAASAARSVQDHGTLAEFWTFAKSLYRNQQSLGLELYGSLASDLGLDGETVRSDAKTEAYRSTVEADRRRGKQLGIRATPTVLVDGQPVTNADGNLVHSAAAVGDAIERALSESG